jgi:uncharacterized membrane protein
MAVIEQAIDVKAPVSRVYGQWLQFREFPQFMQGVKEVRQLDDKRSRWRAEIAGREKMWEAETTQQIPDQRICWRSTFGASNIGSVSFYPLEGGRTRIILWMKYDPSGLAEIVGNLVGIVASRVAGDLKRFKKFIESQYDETGTRLGVTGQRSTEIK